MAVMKIKKKNQATLIKYGNKGNAPIIYPLKMEKNILGV